MLLIKRLFNQRRLILTLSFLGLIIGFTLAIPFAEWRAKAAATIVWDGGGDASAWSDPLNWDLDRVPNTSDEVLIDTAATVIITAPITIKALTLGQVAGGVASVLQFNYDALSLGALTLTEGDLVVYSGTNITHLGGSTTTVLASIVIDVQAGDFDFYGTINVDQKGYYRGYGNGVGVGGGYGTGGAAYGGAGGNGQTGAGGEVYGSNSSPSHLGSGAGDYGLSGGDGGGLVKIVVSGTASINGVISANGGSGSFHQNYAQRWGGGGGSGGSIWLIAGRLTGNGQVLANGGGAGNYTYDGGGGGAGRIAFHYIENTSSFSLLQANGGVASGGSATSGGSSEVYYLGMTAPPLTLRQYQSNGQTLLGQGATVLETTIVASMQLEDGDDTDTLTPEVEVLPIGTAFSNTATHTGTGVSYSGSLVTATVTLDNLGDGQSYHWQARACDAGGYCSSWVSYGDNTEAEADFTVSSNANPNVPTIPSSSFFIDAQYYNNGQPTLAFVQSDDDSGDSISYQIQIDDTANFSSPLIDYTSAAAAQGTQSFVVGQVAGSGTYTVGAASQALTSGAYYWRVKAFDNNSGESAWTTATGTPAFYIDLTRPTNATEALMKAHDEALLSQAYDDEPLWYNRNDLYFEWDEATDNNDIKGYCLYLGDDPEGDPATQKGVLGTSPVSITGSTCKFIVSENSVDFYDSVLRSYEWLTSSEGLYYFKIKAIDVANNVFVGDDVSNLVSFYFDNTAPENVAYITPRDGSIFSLAEVFFTWPTSGVGVASDAHSELVGFQYKINQSDWFGEELNDDTGLLFYPLNIVDPLANREFYLSSEAREYIQLGQNVISFQVFDHAGNISRVPASATFNYGGDAPKFADEAELEVTPTENTINWFAFSWPEAIISDGRSLYSYYYMVNTPAPSAYATITSNSATYIPTTNTSVEAGRIAGLRKGENTITVVAVDDAGNYSSTNALSASFYLYSSLPDPVSNLTVSDNSIKDISKWQAALVWAEPAYAGTGTLTYNVERSEDADTWLNIGSSNGGDSFVDRTVPESKRYYWRVITTDNSNESIASPSYSNAVSLIPKGSYTTPPSLTSGPAASSITTTQAIISWTTSRDGDSKVALGLASGNYFDSESLVSGQVTEHSINLSNLTPGTKYYYKAKWTDEDGNTGESDEKTFTTEPPPEVSEVRISNLGVSGAIINFTTKNATKAKIYYGTSTGFGGMKEIATSKLETSYSVELDKLDDGSKYYYKINTFDEEEEEYEGTILDFSTMPRPRVSGVRVQQVANTAQSSLLVTWESNTEISSVVTYYPENSPELVRDVVNLDLQTGEHQMLIKGLFPDTNYVLRVSGRDIIGNEATSDNLRITTAADSRAPMISDLVIESTNSPPANSAAQTTSSQLIVSWNTDEPATSQVEFGEGSGDTYSQMTQEDQDLSYNHVVIISGLTPSKVYHLRAVSRDSAGNESQSIDTVTITPKATDNAFDLVITNLKEAFGFLSNL